MSARVHHFFEYFEGTCGYRPIQADLVDEGCEWSPQMVSHIMRSEGLVACQPRPFLATTEADAETQAIFHCGPGSVYTSDIYRL